MTAVSILVFISDEKYADRCLKSLKRQTFKDTEILFLLSDFSSLTDLLSENDGIKIVRGKNESALLTAGLAAASSPYIMFCDDVDWYEPSAIERMLDAVKKHDADLVICDVNDVYADDYVKSFTEAVHSATAISRDGKFKADDYADNVFFGNKIFKKSLADSIDLPDETDRDWRDSFIKRYCSKAKNYCVINERLYSVGFNDKKRRGIFGRLFGGKFKKSKNSNILRYKKKKPFIGILKEENEKAFYFCLVPLLRVIKDRTKIKIYFFGICLYNKKNDIKTRILLTKNYILSLNCHKTNDQKHFLLFDCLYDKYAEAIDAYSLYSWMREKGIAATYVLRKDNKLAPSVKKDRRVVLVDDWLDFFLNYPELIGQSSHILTSFGIDNEINAALKALPNSMYIFLEHGVTFFKESILREYNSEYFDSILVPSKPTKDIYIQNGLWPHEKMLPAGLPRWDLLCRRPHFQKNIFCFFTFRRDKSAKKTKAYYNAIMSLLNNPEMRRLCEENDIEINIAVHHQILHSDMSSFSFKGVNIVDCNEISKHIGDADLLLTDYSSICFDFMFLNIPVVFYRFNFDNDDSRDAIHAKDVFIYNCCYSEEQALSKIKHYVDNDFVLEPENIEKNNQFFWSRKNIREAVYDEIINKT